MNFFHTHNWIIVSAEDQYEYIVIDKEKHISDHWTDCVLRCSACGWIKSKRVEGNHADNLSTSANPN